MFYFAYGSNLDPEQMSERCPGHHVVGLAQLADHKLAFPRFSSKWQGGTASVVPSHGRQVWGVVFDVTDEHMAELDRHEGHRGPHDQHNDYDRETVTVDLVRPDDNSVPRRLRATTFVARPSNPQPPSRRYLDPILRGARHHRLPEDYVEALRSETATDEPSSASEGASEGS